MVGFYALALGIVWGLVWIPWAEWHYLHRIHPKLALICLAGAAGILYSIVPRVDRFEAPGPRLIAGQQPRLFAELGRISRSVEQEMPAEVYLVADVNAFVTHRGGLMGFGARRIMGLGLPLLQVMSIAELRAVLAHEFGHFHGGDVKLGPWIYKTQGALLRTIGQLGESALRKPFEWYAHLFFRVTKAVSRHQEYQADALAARVAGSAALAGGLKASHSAGMAFQPYWQGEVVPVLDAGYLPPLAGGFSRFLGEPHVSEKLATAVAEELRSGESERFDSHPALRERLAALGVAGNEPRRTDEPAALTLLDGLASLEKQLLAHLADREKALALKPLDWNLVGSTVLLPRWEGFVRAHAKALAGLKPLDLPGIDWQERGRRLIAVGGHEGVEPLPIAEHAIGAALALILSRAGFQLDAPPGAPVRLSRDGLVIEPFGLRQRLASGGGAEFEQACRSAGIVDAELAAS